MYLINLLIIHEKAKSHIIDYIHVVFQNVVCGGLCKLIATNISEYIHTVHVQCEQLNVYARHYIYLVHLQYALLDNCFLSLIAVHIMTRTFHLMHLSKHYNNFCRGSYKHCIVCLHKHCTVQNLCCIMEETLVVQKYVTVFSFLFSSLLRWLAYLPMLICISVRLWHSFSKVGVAQHTASWVELLVQEVCISSTITRTVVKHGLSKTGHVMLFCFQCQASLMHMVVHVYNRCCIKTGFNTFFCLTVL